MCLSHVRQAVRGALALPGRILHTRRLAGLRRSREREPVVSFGGALNTGRLIHGGAVKLTHLRDAFPWNEQSFNLLYLVSSALPPYAEDLVKRCRRIGIPLIWNQNGVAYPGWAGHDVERYNGPMRRLRAEADYVIYQSAFCRDSAERFLGPCATKSEVIFNPVDLHRFRPAESPPPARPLRLLTLGTHGYAERVLSTLRCARFLIDSGIPCSLTIAGRLGWPGATLETQREIEKLHLQSEVAVLASFTQQQAAELYRAHHLLLHPKYLDPCPTVVIEALASGLPVVASATGGLPEMVLSSGGELIPAPLSWDKLITPTGEQLAAAVARLLPRLAKAAREARSHAEKTYDSARWVRKHASIFRRVLA